jgi:membrane associated rhomboid family serine protease
MALNRTVIVGNLKTISWLLAIMGIALILSYILPINNLGIKPRSVAGLFGILFAPFLHSGFSHLIGNAFVFFVLGTLLLHLEGSRAILIMISVVLISGAGTWLIGGANTVHIGASGLIYGMIGYLLSYGVFKRSVGSIILSVVVLLLYGGAVWGILPADNSVSWEMHLCGFLAGILMAKLNVRRVAGAVQSEASVAPE